MKHPTVLPDNKILIIEDEGDICLLLNLLLEGKHIHLQHVNSLFKAKAFLSAEQPALVFLDNSLPDGRGTDFIDYIKLNCPSTKIVVITAYSSSAERERAFKNGADLFIEKPFTKNEIYNAISKLLEIDPRVAA